MKNLTVLCMFFVMWSVSGASLTTLYELDGNMNDSSGNGYNGVIASFGVSTPAWDPASADPALNGSLTFSGSTGYAVNCGDVPVSATATTIAYWINADVVDNYEPLAKIPNDSSGYGFMVKLRAGGGVRFRVGSENSYTDVVHDSDTGVVYSAGQWVHHAFVYTKFSGTTTVTLYVDGSFVIQKTSTTSQGISAAVGTNLYIGASVDTGVGEAFDGNMDDVRIYDHALSPAEINALPGLSTPDIDPPAPNPATFTVPVSPARGITRSTLPARCGYHL